MQSWFKLLLGFWEMGRNLPLLAVTIPRYTFVCFCTIYHLVYTALPICAHTPAPTALIIKIAVRPAIVIVVTPLSLEKTARSPGGNNKPALTTTINLTSAQAFAQRKVVIAQTSLLIVFYKCGKWVYF